MNKILLYYRAVMEIEREKMHSMALISRVAVTGGDAFASLMGQVSGGKESAGCTPDSPEKIKQLMAISRGKG